MIPADVVQAVGWRAYFVSRPIVFLWELLGMKRLAFLSANTRPPRCWWQARSESKATCKSPKWPANKRKEPMYRERMSFSLFPIWSVRAWYNVHLTVTGYARIIIAAISLYYMRDNPRLCTVLYLVSCILDAFDGKMARLLNQSTRFGAVLDMVTDRCVLSAS